jgi:hypothetical protein
MVGKVEGQAERRSCGLAVPRTAQVSAAIAATTAHGSGLGGTFKLYEHDTTQQLVDLGQAGDSPGDALVFAGDTFTRKGGARRGRVGGTCTTTSTGPTGEALCTLTFSLADGHLVAEGLVRTADLFGGKSQTFAITGGTRRFRHARGQGTIQVPTDVPGRTDAIFTLDPAR